MAALTRPLVLLSAGSVVGMALAMAASGLLASVVYQASPADPVVIAAAPLVMLLCGVLSTAVPGHRALAASPAKLLKDC
jgi:hypothetical protein